MKIEIPIFGLFWQVFRKKFLADLVGGVGLAIPPLPTVPLELATASGVVTGSGGMKWKQVESMVDIAPGTPIAKPLTPNSSKEITKSQIGGGLVTISCTNSKILGNKVHLYILAENVLLKLRLFMVFLHGCLIQYSIRNCGNPKSNSSSQKDAY